MNRNRHPITDTQKDFHRGGRWPRRRIPELIKVTERVYVAVDYALANVIFVLTEEGIVVVDTTESRRTARATLKEIRKVTPLPISHIIYTHFHDDHLLGAAAFHQPGTTIIAHRKLIEERDRAALAHAYKRRVNEIQFGARLNANRRGVSLAYQDRLAARPLANDPAIQPVSYLRPDLLVGDRYEFVSGNVNFELIHAEGETPDHLMVWLPHERVLCTGDLFYNAFPMLSNPMKEDRPILAWATAIDYMRSLTPWHLVPSHSRPRSGAKEVDEVLKNYGRAIRYVHDQTLILMNQGQPLEEIRRRVKLPAKLARLPYLQQGYCKVDWAVAGVFRQYSGWYDLNPTTLKPRAKQQRADALIEICGGPQPIVARARDALQQGQNQLVLELTDIVLAARPQNAAAMKLRRRALYRLGSAATNGVERNIYLSAAATLSSELNGNGKP